MNISSPSRKIAWIAWIIASIFYAYQYILRVMPNIMLQDIMTEFSVDTAVFGQFSGIYYIGYSLIHLPVGIMLDRYGPRKVMSCCMLLTVLGLSPLLWSSSFFYPILGRLLIGIGSSAAILGVFKVIRIAFEEKRFAQMLSFSVMIGLIGAIYGGGPVNSMLAIMGYKTVILLFAVLGTILAAITYLTIPEISTSKEENVLSNVKEVLQSKKVIYTCLFAGLMVGPLEGFADVWSSVFLENAYGLEKALASSLPSMIFVGMCFGSPILSFIAEKAQNYLGTIIVAGIIMTLCFFFLLKFQLPATALSLSFVIVGICSAYQILAIYKASTYVRSEVAGLTTAVANMIIMIFGYGFHTVIGKTIKAFGGPGSTEALSYGIAVVPIALCLGIGGFIFLASLERRKVEASSHQ